MEQLTLSFSHVNTQTLYQKITFSSSLIITDDARICGEGGGRGGGSSGGWGGSRAAATAQLDSLLLSTGEQVRDTYLMRP